MSLFKTSLAVSIAALASVAGAASISKRINEQCYAGVHEVAADRPFVNPLADACIKSLPANDFSGIWNSKLCVGAAVAASVRTLLRDQ